MNYYISQFPFGTTVVKVSSTDTISYIPADPANTDYVAYLEWVAAGNTPEQWNPDIIDGGTE